VFGKFLGGSWSQNVFLFLSGSIQLQGTLGSDKLFTCLLLGLVLGAACTDEEVIFLLFFSFPPPTGLKQQRSRLKN